MSKTKAATPSERAVYKFKARETFTHERKNGPDFHYEEGMTYTVRAGNVDLSHLVHEWAADGLVLIGG